MYGEAPRVSDGGKIVSARKNWECCDCHIPIPKKSKYWTMSGCWDDGWETIRMCTVCRDLRATYEDISHDEGCGFGYLHEMCWELYSEDGKPDVANWLVRRVAIAWFNEHKNQDTVTREFR